MAAKASKGASLKETVSKLNNDIKNGSFRSSYLIYGPESYLIREYRNKLKQALFPDGDAAADMNLDMFEGHDQDEADIAQKASLMPFFAERRLIILKDTGLFKKAKGPLADFLKDPPDTVTLVFTEFEPLDQYGKPKSAVDKRNSLYKTVAKDGLVIECASPTPATFQSWILSKVKKEGKQISRTALDLFMEKALKGGMEMASNELDKLFSYCHGQDTVTDEDVVAIAGDNVSSHVFDMVDSVADRKVKRALDYYNELLKLKEPPLRIMYLLGQAYGRMLIARDITSRGMGKEEVAAALKLPPYPAGKYMERARRHSREDIVRAISLCVEKETDIKQGRVADSLGLELLIVELCE